MNENETDELTASLARGIADVEAGRTQRLDGLTDDQSDEDEPLPKVEERSFTVPNRGDLRSWGLRFRRYSTKRPKVKTIPHPLRGLAKERNDG